MLPICFYKQDQGSKFCLYIINILYPRDSHLKGMLAISY